MKKIIFYLALALILLFSGAARAQQVGLIDHTRVEEFDFSPFYSYSRADFSPVDGTGDVEKLINQILGFRLNFRVSPDLQVHGLYGTTETEFGSNKFDDGTVLGVGFQFLIEPDPQLYMKLTGAFQSHDDQDMRAGSGDIQIVSDWQVGFLLGRHTVETDNFGHTQDFHAYTGVLYSGREVETTNGSSLDYELENFANLSITAGVMYNLVDFLSLELEGQTGAIDAVSGRFIYYF